MNLPTILLIVCICLTGCKQANTKKQIHSPLFVQSNVDSPAYNEVIDKIKTDRKDFAKKYTDSDNKSEFLLEIKNYWVRTIGIELYEQWKGTPWDFNGITRKPKEGNIACGYFVTTLLLDMGYKLNRTKMSTCTAMIMMKSLTPGKPIQNLSYLTYEDFNKKIKEAGKGVFIVGLDYHTGFLINDGTETWFLHSNYIGRKGVIKEKISESTALKQSTSRFVTSITEDNNFLLRWMNNN